MEPLHIRFISRDPTRDLFAGELAWFGWLGPLRPKARRQEQQQFLLLLWRQGVGGSFDFSKRAHPTTVPHRLLNDKPADELTNRRLVRLEVLCRSAMLGPCRSTNFIAESAEKTAKSWCVPRSGKAPPARFAAQPS